MPPVASGSLVDNANEVDSIWINRTSFLAHEDRLSGPQALISDKDNPQWSNTDFLVSMDLNSSSLLRQNDGGFLVTVPSESSTGLRNNSSIAVDLEELMGPRREELYKVVPITIIYCIIFVFGIIGNVSTCIVIARNRFMQTATNFYLFNLAISDLLMLVLGLPQETYLYWSQYPYVFGETFCILRVMAAETSTNASILTITAFTMERYVAICHPMRSQTMSSLRRATKVIILIWIVSAVCSVPIIIQFGIVYAQVNGVNIIESATCNINQGRYLKHAFEVSTFLFFVTPMTIITVLYAMIGLAIRRSTLHRAGSDSSSHSEQTGTDLRAQQLAKARRAVLKMLVAVVVAFFLCWSPFHAQRLMAIYQEGEMRVDPDYIAFQHAFYQVSGILYYFISVINPILYNVMSLKFRQAFKNIIMRPCRSRERQHQRTAQAPQVRTYRFHSRPFLTDTHLTMLQLNGHMKGRAGMAGRRAITDAKYLQGRSHSSSMGSSSSPRGHLVPHNNDPLSDDIELEPVHDYKSNHSYHHQPRNVSAAYDNFRPYHSYA